jgi:hypothetical protein
MSSSSVTRSFNDNQQGDDLSRLPDEYPEAPIEGEPWRE